MQHDLDVRKLRFGPRAERPRDVRRKLEPLEYGAVSLTLPDELRNYLETFRPVFGRRDTLQQGFYYATGLLSDLRRKNGETIEAAVPGATQQGVWDFLVRSPWSWEELDRVRVLDAFRRSGAAGQPIDGVLDEVGWRKKGSLSVGVSRQYLGCIGKVDNGQVAVSLHGCSPQIDLPLLGELYLPEAWLKDAERRKHARIPEDRVFLTKPEIGIRLIDRALDWGLVFNRIFADPGYADLDFIQALRDRNLPFCLGVKSTAVFWLPDEDWLPAVPAGPYSGHGRPRIDQPALPHLHTVADLRAGIADAHWHPVAYRDGIDGEPLVREFVALRAHLTSSEQVKAGAAEAAGTVWLLLERPRASGAKDDYKQYVLSGPDTMTLDELALLAHRRPIIERNSYENAKQEVGLSQYQGRSWIGFHHHLSMAWLALTFLILHRNPLPPTDSTPATPSQPEPPPPAAPSSASFGDTSVPLAVAPLAPEPLPRPHQVWESVQEVHRRLIEWFRGLRFREILFAGRMPPLPSLGPVPLGP